MTDFYAERIAPAGTDVDADGPFWGARCPRCGTFHDVVAKTGCPLDWPTFTDKAVPR